MSRKYFLGLISVTMLTWWGCSSFNETRRYPSGTKDVGIINSKFEVILFYRENDKIIIKQCEDYTSLKSRSDCKVKSGTGVQNVPVNDFKSSLKIALKLPGGNYDADTKRKIELDNSGQKDDVKELSERQKELKSQVIKIEAFFKDLGVNEDTEDLLSLKAELSQVESDLSYYTELAQVSKKINERIDYLVDKLISSKQLYKYTFLKQKTGFVFNILTAYLRASMISASFQRIARGSFVMGSSHFEDNRHRDELQKGVTISQAFDIMTTEVTQMQWFLVMGTNPSRFKKPEDCENHININGEGLCPNNPVEQVSWNDVQAYIKKLNDSLGLSGCNGAPSDSKKGCYRLPTEAEWEFAARGETTTAYSCGDSSSSLGSYAWYGVKAGSKTHPVGLKRANPNGLYDVHGNVWEWVQDKYKDRLTGGTNPLHISSGSYRVIRGGSWANGAEFLRSAVRSVGKPDDRDGDIGFRLVRTL